MACWHGNRPVSPIPAAECKHTLYFNNSNEFEIIPWTKAIIENIPHYCLYIYSPTSSSGLFIFRHFRHMRFWSFLLFICVYACKQNLHIYLAFHVSLSVYLAVSSFIVVKCRRKVRSKLSEQSISERSSIFCACGLFSCSLTLFEAINGRLTIYGLFCSVSTIR